MEHFDNNVKYRASLQNYVIDTGDAYKLESELPGFKKEDIKIDIENDCSIRDFPRKRPTQSGTEKRIPTWADGSRIMCLH